MDSNEQASVSTSKLVKAVSIAVALHELSAQTLPVRVLGDQRLALTDQPGVAPELECASIRYSRAPSRAPSSWEISAHAANRGEQL